MAVETSMQIINGTQLARQHEQSLKKRLEVFQGQVRDTRPDVVLRRPVIVSFCNEQDKPSVIYTGMKQRKAEQIGIEFRVINFTDQTPQALITNRIRGLNEDNGADGVMIQLPLPNGLNIFQPYILEQISSDKDVDGLTPKGRELYLPATVASVMSILNEQVQTWPEMNIGVAGAAGEVGRPLVDALRRSASHLNLVTVDRKISGTALTDLRGCDLVISVIGRKHIISADMLMPGVVIIDVGLGGSSQEGDFSPDVYNMARMGTMPKGGVGPMTVISLMENGVLAYKKHIIRQLGLPENFGQAA